MTKVIEGLTDKGIQRFIQHGGSVMAVSDSTPERVIEKVLKYPKIGEVFFAKLNKREDLVRGF